MYDQAIFRCKTDLPEPVLAVINIQSEVICVCDIYSLPSTLYISTIARVSSLQ